MGLVDSKIILHRSAIHYELASVSSSTQLFICDLRIRRQFCSILFDLLLFYFNLFYQFFNRKYY